MKFSWLDDGAAERLVALEGDLAASQGVGRIPPARAEGGERLTGRGGWTTSGSRRRLVDHRRPAVDDHGDACGPVDAGIGGGDDEHDRGAVGRADLLAHHERHGLRHAPHRQVDDRTREMARADRGRGACPARGSTSRTRARPGTRGRAPRPPASVRSRRSARGAGPAARPGARGSAGGTRRAARHRSATGSARPSARSASRSGCARGRSAARCRAWARPAWCARCRRCGSGCPAPSSRAARSVASTATGRGRRPGRRSTPRPSRAGRSPAHPWCRSW